MATGDIRAGGAYVELGTKGDIGKQLDATARRLKAFGDSVSGVGRTIGAIGASVLTPLLGAAAAFGVMGKELEIASQKTGIAVESLSALKYAAEQSGASFDDVTTGIRKMQKALIEASNGSAPAVEALRSLGLTIQNLRGLTPEQQFQLIADRLGAVQSASLKTSTALALFGRGGTSLIPMLSQMAELEARARSLGIVMSTEDAQAATKFQNTLRDLYDQLKAVTFQIGAAVGESLQPFASALRSILPELIQFTREHREMIQVSLALGIGLVATGGALVLFGQSIKLLGSSWLGVTKLFTTGGALLRSAIALPVSLAVGSFNALVGAAALAGTVVTTAMAGVGAVVAFALSPIGLIAIGLTVAAAAAIYFSGVGGRALGFIGQIASGAAGKIKNAFAGAFAYVKPIFDQLKSTALKTFGGIADALSAGDIVLAGRILWSGLELAWLQGTQGLRSIWSGFLNYFGGVWEAVVGVMRDVWHSISDAVMRTINDIHEAASFVSGGDYTADADNNEIGNKREKDDADRTKKEIDDQSKRYDHSSSEAAGIKTEEASLQKQLDALRAKAADKKTAVQIADKGAADKQTAEEDEGDKVPPSKSESKSIGLFNVAGIAGLNLGGGSQQDRIADATEQTAKNTGAIASGKTASGSSPHSIGAYKGHEQIARIESGVTSFANKAMATVGLNMKDLMSLIPFSGKNGSLSTDLRSQNANQPLNGYRAGGRVELTDAKKNDDGTYTVRSSITGITAKITNDQLDKLEAQQAASPKLPSAQIEAGTREAMRRRDALMHPSPNVKALNDKNSERIAKATEDGNKYLKILSDNLPVNTFT